MSQPLLEVRNLRVRFETGSGTVQAVRGVSFQLHPGETLALVGESGCGKSVTLQSLLRLVPSPPARIEADGIFYKGEDLTAATPRRLRSLYGREFGMIFQDPMTSLNPTMRVGRQITEGILKHQPLGGREAEARAIELLKRVGIPNPERNMLRYPHTYSGGMRQRIMIAIALASNPGVLFADEPTTALDVTTQAQILELMDELKAEFGMAIVLVTHDLGVVARMAQRVAVMYAGKIVESGPVEDLFARPRHPYTWGLLYSLPRIDSQRRTPLPAIPGAPPDLAAPPPACPFAARCPFAMKVCHQIAPPATAVGPGHEAACWLLDPRAPQVDPAAGFADFSPNSAGSGAAVRVAPRAAGGAAPSQPAARPLLEVRDLRKYFPVGRGQVLHAVDGVSFAIPRGTTLGLVGESGCGKTTVGRTILRLYRPDAGQVLFDGEDVHAAGSGGDRRLARRMQMIFQDPYASLNPRLTVGDAIAEGLVIHEPRASRAEIRQRVAALLDRVGLSPDHANRFPHEFSGGQRQRVGIARALALEPEFIVCDEAVSALDVSIQAQIINLLMSLQDELGLTYLFIAHDLRVIRHLSDRTAVMYLGTIVEQADTEQLFSNPLHPYTRALLSAAPVPDPVAERERPRVVLPGDVPSPINPPPGCRFRSRCPLASPLCAEVAPDLVEQESGHFVACHHV